MPKVWSIESVASVGLQASLGGGPLPHDMNCPSAVELSTEHIPSTKGAATSSAELPATVSHKATATNLWEAHRKIASDVWRETCVEHDSQKHIASVNSFAVPRLAGRLAIWPADRRASCRWIR